MSFLKGLDNTKRELEAQFPGWHIWYIPHLNRSVTWCAQPWSLINSQSPEHLAADITEAHSVAAADWPALANRADYAVTAPGVSQPEAR